MADEYARSILDRLRTKSSTPSEPFVIRSNAAPEDDTAYEQSILSRLRGEPEPVLGRLTAMPLPPRKPTRHEVDLDQLHLNLQKAADKTAQQAARNAKLSKTLGVPAVMLPADAEARAYAKQNDAEELIRDFPDIARYLGKPENAEIAGRNVESLKKVRSAMYRATVDPVIDLTKGAAVGVPETLIGIASLFSKGKAGKAIADAGIDTQQFRQRLESLYSPERKEAMKASQDADGFLEQLAVIGEYPSVAAGAVTESLPVMLTGGAIGQAVRKAFPKMSALVAGAVGEGTVIAGGSAEKIRQQTEDGGLTGTQVALSVGAGAAGGVTGVLGAKIMQKLGFGDLDTALVSGKLTDALAKSAVPKGLAANIVAGGVGEGLLEEMPQSAIEQIAENVALGKQWDEGVGSAMAMGLVTGTAMGSGFGALRGAAERTQAEDPSNEALDKATDTAAVQAINKLGKAVKAQQEHEQLTSLVAAASEDVLRKEAPEAFKDFVRSMAEEGDSITDVYVDGELFDQTLKQSGLDIKSLQQNMPDLAHDLQVALQTKGDLRLSIEDFAAHIVGTGLENTLLPEMRTDPYGMTLKESETFYQQQKDEFIKQAEDIVRTNQPVLTRQEFEGQQPDGDYAGYLKAHANRTEVFAKDTQEVHDKLLSGMTQARRFNRMTNEVYATMFREFYAVNAAREGILPSELYARLPLNFSKLDLGEEQFAQFAGEKAATADPTNLGHAKRLEEEGASDETIRKATNWFRGADRKWRFEISDEGARLTASGELFQDVLIEVAQRTGSSLFKLGDVLDHPKLYEAYPGAKNIPIYSMDAPRGFAGSAAFGPDGIVQIDINRGLTEYGALSTLLHEVQHYIQSIEDFASGGNSDDMRVYMLKNATPEQLAAARALPNFPREGTPEAQMKFFETYMEHITGGPMRLYARLAGETEARNVQERMGFTEEERGLIPPSDTQDYPYSDQIIQYYKSRLRTANDMPVLDLGKRNLGSLGRGPATEDDFTKENADGLLGKDGWAILTAANPNSTTQSDAENEAANAKLRNDLESKGLKYEVVQGMYSEEGVEIESYLVYGVGQEAANQLGNQYGQESVLTREGLVYADGAVTPVNKLMQFDTTAEAMSTGYTRVPRTGLVFSFDLDWSRERGVKQGALSLVGTHYSGRYRDALKGSYYGTGLPGQKADRLEMTTDERIKTRVDFYADLGKGAKPAAGLGSARHDVMLHNIYNGAVNPLGLRYPSDWLGANVFEQQVLDAGFDGYYIKQGEQGRVVVLGRAAEAIPTGYNKDGQREAGFLQESTGAYTGDREADGSLQGLPRNIQGYAPSHWPEAERVTREYMASVGSPYSPPNHYRKVDGERAKRIAAAFDEMKHDPNNPTVKAAYAALARETVEQYKAVINSGLVVEFINGKDPYAGNPRAMTEDVRNNNHMWVFSTREGFGADVTFDPTDNPLLAETEFEISGQKALLNDLFRVVHDYFGHVKEGVGFRADGEENAWRTHMAMFSPLAGRALTTETRGQNSWVNFGPHAEHNRTASGEATIYADQKTGLLPEWVSKEGVGDGEMYGQSDFYSALERNIGGLKKVTNKEGAVKAPQAVQWIEARMKEGLFKREEVEAVGLLDWLRELQTVYVSEVEQFVRNNGVQVVSVWPSAMETTEYRVMINGHYEEFYDELEAEQALQAALDDADTAYQETEEGALLLRKGGSGGLLLKFAQEEEDVWRLERGLMADNYDMEGTYSEDEVRDILDSAEQEYNDEVYSEFSQVEKVEEADGEPEVMFGDYTLGGGDNYQELALVLDNPKGVLYTIDGHEFSNPEANDNRLAHVRFNTRWADGKKVLFIEEIQSDWAQGGRERGFKRPLTAEEEEYRLLVRKGWKRTEDDEARFAELKTSGVADSYDELLRMEEPAPFVTDTKSWVTLTAKRMLRYAVENGFDSVAWTTGKQQSSRYNLATVVNNVQAVRMDDDARLYSVMIEQRNGRRKNFDDIQEKDLAGMVGVELADKIVNHPDMSDKGAEFSGLDLEVGGEGMKAFYDKGGIVDQVFSKTLKQLRGGKTYTMRMGEGEGPKEVGDQPGFDITPELKASVMQGLPLFQGQRAGFNPRTFTISLLKGADLSSVIHEGGHFYLEALYNLASQPNADPRTVEDYKTTLRWFGLNEDTAWDKLSVDQKRPHHEQWAQSFERYTLEGKAPTLEMQPVFQRFRAWMLSVYKSLKEFLKQNPLAGKLNDDIRAVFDRLIASQEAIEEAEKAREYAPLFTSAEDAEVTAKQFSEYMEAGRRASQDATDELNTRSIRDMKWLSNARSKALKDLQNEARMKRKLMRKEVEAEIAQEPIERARLFLTKGEYIDDNGSTVKATSFKLDRKAVRELAPNVNLNDVRGMTEEGGVSPGLAAQMFGFGSAEELLNELINGEPTRSKIQGETDRRMIEEYSDLADEDSLNAAADEAVHNEARARFMATGLKMLAKTNASAPKIVKAAKQAAESVIAGKLIRDIKPGQYARAETKNNKEALKLAPKDRAQAAVAQRAALLNNKLYAVSRDASREIDQILKYVKKFENQKLGKSVDFEYLEQINDLLSPFNFQNRTLKDIDKSKSLLDWVQEQEANGFEPAIDITVMEQLKQKHYKDMTLEELRGLRDTIKQIEHIGRLKHKLLTAKNKAEFQAAIDEASESIIKNANRTVEERGTPSDVAGKVSQWLRQAAASHRKFSSVMREMDGGKDNGVMWNLLSRSMNEAGDKETEMRQQAAKKMAELFKLVDLDQGVMNLYAKKRLVPGTKLSMTHEQRIMFGMNWGNEGNRQRLLDGGVTGQRAISTQEAKAVLDTLTKPEWDFIQATWDYIGTYKEEVRALETRLTGVEPEWVEPVQVQTKFGTYAGGYFPAKYDTELSTRSESLEASTDLRMAMKGVFQSAATRSGYVQARADQVVNRPLLLSFNVIPQHINEVIHRLSWQPWLTDANRVLKALDQPIREHYGTEILRELRNTVVDIATGDAPAKNAIESSINRIRVGSTVVGMGWKVSTALLQPTGLAQSYVRVGPKWMTKGLLRFLGSPLDSAEFADTRSSMMRNRGITMQREINEVLNTLRAGETASNLKASYFILIGKMQRTVDIPTWLGAYEKGLADLGYENAADEAQRKEMEERAVSLADQAVIDSQSGGMTKDLAGVQRGSPIQRLFTNFYSYFSATYNLNIEAVRRTSFKSPSEVGVLAVNMLLLNVVPVIFGLALKEATKGECGDDLDCLAEKLAQEQVSYMLGQVVLLRELSASASAIIGDDNFGYQGPAGLRFFNEVYKTGVQLGQGDFDQPLFKAVNNSLGTVFHYPAGFVNNVADGIVAVEEGRVEGVSILPALIFGPPKE